MESITRCKPLLGTYVEVQLTGDMDKAQLFKLSDTALTEIEHIESLMSFHNPESEISRINRQAFKQPCSLSTQTQKVIKQALSLSAQTKGIFDITVAPNLVEQGLLPDHHQLSHHNASWKDIRLEAGYIKYDRPLLIDLGGIAKGFAVDQAFAAIESEPVEIIINAGGDLRMSHWQRQKASIRRRAQQQYLTEVEMKNAALATSANHYKQDSYPIICPLTRTPVKHSKVVSVFADNCMLADALTKVIFIDGPSKTLVESLNAQAMIIQTNLKS